MLTNCVNCGAVIDRELDKCPYCDTPYDYNGFSAEVGEFLGTMKIAGKTCSVYLGDVEYKKVGVNVIFDKNGKPCGNQIKTVRKFTLIEV